MTKIVPSRSVSAVPSPAPKAATPFGNFQLTNVGTVRAKAPFTGSDGGTLLLDGKLNGETARVRIDGAYNSPTRGQAFVELPGGGGERPMTKEEISELRGSIRRFAGQDSSDPTSQRARQQLAYAPVDRDLGAALAKAATVTPFSNFQLTNVDTVRAQAPFTGSDGGTLLLDGKLNGQNARVRIDGAFNSPTRGQVFVQLSGGGERPMTKEELSDLRGSIRRFAGQDSSDPASQRARAQLGYASVDRELGAALARLQTERVDGFEGRS